MQHIGTRIKALREERNMSQAQLAIKTGYTDRTSISKIESGKIDITQTKLSVFARALGTSVETLIGLENKPSTMGNIDEVIRLITLAQGNRSQNEFALHCGFNASTISKIKARGAMPSPALIKKIAARAHNGVTYDQLMQAAGYVVYYGTPTTPPASLTDNQRVLLDLFRQVPEDKQALVVQMIKAAVSELNKT